eukprot:COSAG02_NODE_2865_length_7868_cov_42.736002_5_plen_161_part_00
MPNLDLDTGQMAICPVSGVDAEKFPTATPHFQMARSYLVDSCIHFCYTRVIVGLGLWAAPGRHVFASVFRRTRMPCQYHERLLRCLRQNGSHARAVPKHWLHPPEAPARPARWMPSTVLSHCMTRTASLARRSFSVTPRSVPPDTCGLIRRTMKELCLAS